MGLLGDCCHRWIALHRCVERVCVYVSLPSINLNVTARTGGRAPLIECADSRYSLSLVLRCLAGRPRELQPHTNGRHDGTIM